MPKDFLVSDGLDDFLLANDPILVTLTEPGRTQMS